MKNYNSPESPDIKQNKPEQEIGSEGEKDYEERYGRLKGIMAKVYKAENRDELLGRIAGFHRFLMNKYDNHSKVRCFHVLGASSLGGEPDKMTTEELLEKGHLASFDFKGDDSVEEFLSGIEQKIK